MLENKEILYMNEVNETKKCSKCGRELPLERFSDKKKTRKQRNYVVCEQVNW